MSIKMSHHVVEKFEDIKVGTEICTGYSKWCTVLENANGIIRCRYFFYEALNEPEDRTITITEKEYLHTHFYSQDWKNSKFNEYYDARDSWAECEKHYGISHLGSNDPDPIRQFALAVLKGDPVAIDAIKDTLKI